MSHPSQGRKWPGISRFTALNKRNALLKGYIARAALRAQRRASLLQPDTENNDKYAVIRIT